MMTSRDKIEVKQIKLSPQKMQAAMVRASENSKSRIVWQDRKVSSSVNSQGK